MSKLPHAKRALVLNLLCEGSSLQSVCRVADVSINDETVRNVRSKRVQCDELWSCIYTKA